MHCPASQSDADGYWVARFGKLTRVSWTLFWEEADSAQLHLTEDILLKKQFEDNVASVHGSIELSEQSLCKQQVVYPCQHSFAMLEVAAEAGLQLLVGKETIGPTK